jgi:hypothetical protein
VVCSLETSSQLARPRVTAGRQVSAHTAAVDEEVTVAEEECRVRSDNALHRWIVACRLPLREYRSGARGIVGLGNWQDLCKAACSHQLPCFVPFAAPVRLDMLHQTGPLFSSKNP